MIKEGVKTTSACAFVLWQSMAALGRAEASKAINEGTSKVGAFLERLEKHHQCEAHDSRDRSTGMAKRTDCSPVAKREWQTLSRHRSAGESYSFTTSEMFRIGQSGVAWPCRLQENSPEQEVLSAMTVLRRRRTLLCTHLNLSFDVAIYVANKRSPPKLLGRTKSRMSEKLSASASTLAIAHGHVCSCAVRFMMSYDDASRLALALRCVCSFASAR
eukprot:6198358-Pleurochrysis_carterae.AAC.1